MEQTGLGGLAVGGEAIGSAALLAGVVGKARVRAERLGKLIME